MINREYAKTNDNFRKACGLAGIPVTSRQASKFRRRKGKAFGFNEEARSTPKKAPPTIEEVGGSDPDFTGDLTTEEYIKTIR